MERSVPQLVPGGALARAAAVGLGWPRHWGPMRARFSDFLRGPRTTLAYARAVLAASEPRFLGQNPPGGWMILRVLSTVAVAGVSGWLSTTDRFWGSQPVEAVHECAANLLLLLIALHVAGVIFASLRHRDNLVLAMITGRKRPN